jgi:hypothetical protein
MDLIECSSCHTDDIESKGLYCQDGDEHFTCDNCLCRLITDQYVSSKERICSDGFFRCCVNYNGSGNVCNGRYDLQPLIAHLEDDDTQMSLERGGTSNEPCKSMSNRIRQGVNDMCQEIARNVQRELDLEASRRQRGETERQERLSALSTEDRHSIIDFEEIFAAMPDLELKCPSCNNIFTEWSGCISLECPCRTLPRPDEPDRNVLNFCGYCDMSGNSKDVHEHIRDACPYSGEQAHRGPAQILESRIYPSQARFIEGRKRYNMSKVSRWLSEIPEPMRKCVIYILWTEFIIRLRGYAPHQHPGHEPNKCITRSNISNTRLLRVDERLAITMCLPINWYDYDFIDYHALYPTWTCCGKNVVGSLICTVCKEYDFFKDSVRLKAQLWFRWSNLFTEPPIHPHPLVGRSHLEHLEGKVGIVSCNVCVFRSERVDLFIGCDMCNYHVCDQCAIRRGERS